MNAVVNKNQIMRASPCDPVKDIEHRPNSSPKLLSSANNKVPWLICAPRFPTTTDHYELATTAVLGGRGAGRLQKLHGAADGRCVKRAGDTGSLSEKTHKSVCLRACRMIMNVANI
jgi:hypothetical protein